MSKRLPATLCHRVLDGSFALFGTLNSKLSGHIDETNKSDKLLVSMSQAGPGLPTRPLQCNATDGTVHQTRHTDRIPSSAVLLSAECLSEHNDNFGISCRSHDARISLKHLLHDADLRSVNVSYMKLVPVNKGLLMPTRDIGS